MTTNLSSQPEQTQAMWDFFQALQASRTLETVHGSLLASISRLLTCDLTTPPGVVLYLGDARFPAAHFYQHGLDSQAADEVERLCAVRYQQAVNKVGISNLAHTLTAPGLAEGAFTLHALVHDNNVCGLLGHTGERLYPTELGERLCAALALWADEMASRWRSDRQLAQLNTYLTVSSMMSQSQGLHELLEVALYCCMEAVDAETASVLLLDDEQRNFRFYHVEGPSKLVLEATVFPAGQGLAGSVLSSRQSEVINDVQHDPRFYGKVDQDFRFRNPVDDRRTPGSRGRVHRRARGAQQGGWRRILRGRPPAAAVHRRGDRLRHPQCESVRIRG